MSFSTCKIDRLNITKASFTASITGATDRVLLPNSEQQEPTNLQNSIIMNNNQPQPDEIVSVRYTQDEGVYLDPLWIPADKLLQIAPKKVGYRIKTYPEPCTKKLDMQKKEPTLLLYSSTKKDSNISDDKESLLTLHSTARDEPTKHRQQRIINTTKSSSKTSSSNRVGNSTRPFAFSKLKASTLAEPIEQEISNLGFTNKLVKEDLASNQMQHLETVPRISPRPTAFNLDISNPTTADKYSSTSKNVVKSKDHSTRDKSINCSRITHTTSTPVSSKKSRFSGFIQTLKNSSNKQKQNNKKSTTYSGISNFFSKALSSKCSKKSSDSDPPSDKLSATCTSLNSKNHFVNIGTQSAENRNETYPHLSPLYTPSRYPLNTERAIYRLSGIKLSRSRRPLHQQVVISNMMYWYLDITQQQYQKANSYSHGSSCTKTGQCALQSFESSTPENGNNLNHYICNCNMIASPPTCCSNQERVTKLTATSNNNVSKKKKISKKYNPVKNPQYQTMIMEEKKPILFQIF